MKKIMFFQHSGAKGGAPNSLLLLIKFLNKDLLDYNLVCISDGPMVSHYIKEIGEKFILKTGIYPFHGSTVIKLNFKLFLRNFIRLPQSIYNSYLFIKKNNPSVIHLNSSCLFAIAIASKIYNRNIKVICHLREPLRENSLCGRIIKYFSLKFIDNFIAIDKYSASTMNESIEVIPNVVDLSFFEFKLTNNYIRDKFPLLPKNNMILLFLARIAESNGVLELIKEFNYVSKKSNDISLIISGFKQEERHDEYVNKVIKYSGNNNSVYNLDYASNIKELISSTDIIIVPFIEPHFARCIIEACSLGIPSIGRNISGVNDLIIHGKTGYIYNNEDEMYKYIMLLKENKDLYNKMASNCREFAFDNFHPIKNTTKIMKYYV